MRVIAGTYRGRKLRTPSGMGTRPTTDRVKEALFNVLGGSVQELRVLDCFSGSGSLGIEALSRGARSVVFVEQGREAAEVLRANLAAIGLDRAETARLLQRPLEKAIAQLSAWGPYDLWLVDPPFPMLRDGSAQKILSAMVRADLVAPDGLIVVEFPGDKDCPVIEGLRAEDVRHYGDCRLAFFHPENDPGVK